MRWLRYIVVSVNVLAGLALLAIGAAAWVIGSESGTAWFVETLARRAAPELRIGAVHGTLAGTLDLENVSVAIGDDEIEIDTVGLSIGLGRLLARAVVIESLRVGIVRVSYTAGGPPAEAASPLPLDLPVAIVVEDAAIARVELTLDGETRVAERTRLAGSLIGPVLELARFETQAEGFEVATTGRAELGAEPALDLDVVWSGEVDGRRWAGRGTLGGTWPVVTLEHALAAPVALTASGTLDLDDELRLDLELAWTELAWPGVDAVTSPEGTLIVSGGLERLEYRAAGRLLAEGVAVDVEAEGTASPQEIELAPLEVAIATGRVTATGRFVVAERRFELSAEGRELDPSLFAPGWPGAIDASGELSGTLEPMLEVDFDEVMLDGRVRDYPFTASLAGRYRAPRSVTLDEAEIVSGGDRVTLEGTLDETIDLNLEAHVAELDLLWPELEGVVDARLTVSGTLEAPRAAGTLEVEGLEHGDNALAAANLSGSAELFPGGTLDVSLTGSGLALGNVDAAAVDGRLAGTLGAHEIAVTLDGAGWRTAVAARGALDGTRWDGRLERWEIEQAAVGLWQLANAATVRLAPGDIGVEEICLARLDAELCAALEYTGSAEDRLAVRARSFDLRMLAPVIPEGFELDGRYGLDATFTDLSGEPSGELRIDGGATRVAFQASERDRVATEIDSVRMTATLAARRLELDLALDGRDTGQVSLAAVVDDVRDDASPLQGRLEANWSDLGVLSLVSPDIGAVRGSAQIVLDLGGTLEQPDLEGRAAWRDGAAEIPPWGVAVERIEANATSADGGSLEFDASAWIEDAELRLSGRTELDATAGFPTRLSLIGESVPIVQLPEAEVYVTPDLDIEVTLPNVRVDGTVLVPRARLELEELPEQAVRPSDDAVVHGGELEEPVRPLTVNGDIRVVLGDDVTYVGSNLDSTLSGDLRIQYASGETANASGTLRIDGSYDAYGQSLDLERGELIFSGPLDDPNLDVRAVRTIGETTVGVALSGSLQSPQTRLFSDPAMSEADALAYLLLGRPLQDAGDNELVQGAALSMGLQQALPVVQRIGETLGLDELSIEANDVDTGALMAGKYLSPKVYIRYSYGLFNRIGGLLLRFRINERISLETRSGDEKSMDLLYTVEKD